MFCPPGTEARRYYQARRNKKNPPLPTDDPYAEDSSDEDAENHKNSLWGEANDPDSKIVFPSAQEHVANILVKSFTSMNFFTPDFFSSKTDKAKKVDEVKEEAPASPHGASARIQVEEQGEKFQQMLDELNAEPEEDLDPEETESERPADESSEELGEDDVPSGVTLEEGTETTVGDLTESTADGEDHANTNRLASLGQLPPPHPSETTLTSGSSSLYQTALQDDDDEKDHATSGSDEESTGSADLIPDPPQNQNDSSSSIRIVGESPSDSSGKEGKGFRLFQRNKASDRPKSADRTYAKFEAVVEKSDPDSMKGMATLSSISKDLFVPPSPHAKESLYQGDSDSEASTDEEEQHVGSKVFMMTQGSRYSLTSPSGRNLWKIHEEGEMSESEVESLNGDVDEAVVNSLLNQSRFLNFLEERKEPDDDDSLEFKPRLEDPEEDLGSFEEDCKCDISVRSAPSTPNGRNGLSLGDDASHRSAEKCFGGIKLVSPSFFDSNSAMTPTRRAKSEVVCPHLSSMIYAMDLSLFTLPPETSEMSRCDSFCSEELSVSSCPVQRSPSSVLQLDQYRISGKGKRSKRLSSSFRSSKSSSRVAYSLSSGKKSMSKSERLYSQSFLPSRPVLDLELGDKKPSEPGDKKPKRHRGSLYILLLECDHKVFEVVSVDVQRDTTIGDALAKARSSATDPLLSEQKYFSLCNSTQELAAPMLPVDLLMNWDENKNEPLIAVPAGATAVEVREVKRILWENPRTKRWWEQADPFQPKKETKKKKDVTTPTPKKTKRKRSRRSFFRKKSPVVEVEVTA
jgi:hypothetical protein